MPSDFWNSLPKKTQMKMKSEERKMWAFIRKCEKERKGKPKKRKKR